MLSSTEWHVKNHTLSNGSLPREDDCLRCMVARAKCENKIDYKTRAAADDAALKINIERHWWPGACLKAYNCRYCNVWHLTTAKRDKELRYIEKTYRKWLRKTHQKTNDNDRRYNERTFGYPETG